MDQDMTTRIFKWYQRASWHGLRVMVIILALGLMTTMAFAQSADDLYISPSEGINASNPRWMIRAEANPAMNVAQWYIPPDASSAFSARWMIRADANPAMNVAQWYIPADASSAFSARWMIRADANPGMNVAQWYMPAEAGTQDQLCAVEGLECN